MTPMIATKRTTVYLEADVHRALRLKAAAADRTVSEMVNAAVRAALSEDAEDLAAFDERAREREIPFDAFVKDLRRRGRL
jgi:plasmid stability protein